MHPVESEMLCSLVTPTRIPYFNAPIYLENKTQIGKVDEILGPINEVFFTVKMESGMVASSFKKEDKVYIGGDKLLPIERFLPKPKGTTESTPLHFTRDTKADLSRESRWTRWWTWWCSRRWTRWTTHARRQRRSTRWTWWIR